ncbi:MAG: hypothetical protein OSA51_02185 [Octadecabacter sp.]|nr:hypothetical protein [Octadecabacter sp.]
MTQIDPNTVTGNEHGVIRIYAIDLPADQIPQFTQRQQVSGNDLWPLQDALGVMKNFNKDFIKILDVAALGEIGLAGYLTLGNGVTEADVAPYIDVLTRVQGHIVIVFSSAFRGEAQTLALKRPLRFIAAFCEESAVVTFQPLPDESAKVILPKDLPRKKPKSDAAMSGRVATIALLVMGLLVWLMIKVSG